MGLVELPIGLIAGGFVITAPAAERQISILIFQHERRRIPAWQ
jgi:hypothetical protein